MFIVSFDKIKVWSPVGLFEQETILKNELEVSVSIANNTAHIDQLPYYDYGQIFQIVQQAVEHTTPYLEDILCVIVSKLKQEWAGILVSVVVTKLQPPIISNTAAASVAWKEF